MANLYSMCRNIRTLYNFEPSATEDEVRGAALQYVRKISGFTKPSKANEVAFNSAIEEVAAICDHLLRSLETTAALRNAAVVSEAWADANPNSHWVRDPIPGDLPPLSQSTFHDALRAGAAQSPPANPGATPP